MGCSCKSCDCEKEIKVSFCPKCKSSDVKYVFELGNLFGVVPKMRCGKCKFEMQSFPILVTTKKALMSSDKTKKKVVKKNRRTKK